MVGICKNISEPRCGREFKRPLHRLVRQLRSSSLDPTTLGRKVQKRCARQTFFWFRTFRFFGTCGLSVAVCERNRTLVLCYFTVTRQDGKDSFFQTYGIITISVYRQRRYGREKKMVRVFSLFDTVSKKKLPFRRKCVCVCEPRDKNKKATKQNAFKLFRAACAYFTFCRLTEARCVEHRSGDGRSWRGAKTARSDKVKRLKYTRELGGSDGKSIKFKNRMRCEDRKMWRRLWLSFTTNFPSTEDIESWAERPLSMAGVITNELRLELYRLYVSRTFIEQARSTRRPVRCTLSYGHDTRRENSNGCECTARPELCVGSDLSRKNVKNFFLTVTGLRQVISTKLGCNAKNILRILAWQQRI